MRVYALCVKLCKNTTQMKKTKNKKKNQIKRNNQSDNKHKE